MTAGLALSACGDDDATTTNPAGSDSGPDVATLDSTAPDSSPPDSGVDAAPTVASNVLYMMSNDPTNGNNSVYGYHRAADGSLTAITGSPWKTGGTGIGNPAQMLGPEDSDYQLITSPDHTKLFAVNGGSDTISVFTISPDGTLAAVAGSPFSSGGLSPVSMALVGSYLLVTNQARDLGRTTQDGTNATYATLAVSPTGVLTPATGVTPQPAGITAQLLLPTADGKVLFGAEFTFSAATATPGIRSFTLGTDGSLTKAPGDIYAIPDEDGGAAGTLTNQLVLGMALNPVNKVLYIGQLGRGEIGAWSYDTTGALTYHGAGKVSGAAPCWVRVNAKGTFAYVSDTATDQISVMSVSSDGLTLKEIQAFNLAGAGPIIDGGGNGGHTSSETYDEEISPDGKFLYVESERLTNDPAYKAGNIVHVLAIDKTAGTLTETSTVAVDPTLGDTTINPVRSEGLVVF